MKLTGLEISAFGCWRGLRWPHVDPGLNVVYGPNEAGKTTLLQFLRTMFFGATTPRLGRYLDEAGDLVAGGGLELDSHRGRLRLVRHFTRTAAPGGGKAQEIAGQVELYNPEGGRQSDSLWRSLLAGVDDRVFQNVFAVGLREIQELGTLTDTAAADLLYGLSTGVDRVSVLEVARELRRGRERLHASDAPGGKIAQLLAQRDRLRDELAELENSAGAQGGLVREREMLAQEITRWEEQSEHQRQRGERLESALSLAPKWQACRALESELAALPTPREVSRKVLARLERIQKQMASLAERTRSLKDEREQLAHEAAQLAVDEHLERHAPRVEALAEQRELIETLEEQVRGLEAEVRDLSSKVRGENRAGNGRKGGLSRSLVIELKSTATLLGKSRKAYGASRKLAAARRREKTARQDQRQREERQERDERFERPENLTLALEEAGRDVSLLRRRVQIEQRIDSLTRQRRDLDEQLQQSWEDELLSERALWVTGALVSGGVAALLAGWLLPETVIGSGGGLLMMLGLGLTGAGGLAKYSLERQAAQDAEVAQRQHKLVEKQFREVQQERDEIDRQLPASTGPLVSRLKEAEDYLARLEQFLPLERDRRPAERGQRRPTRSLKELRRRYERAKSRWTQLLSRAGLPPETTPRQVRELIRDDRESEVARERLMARREELADRRRALDDFTGRIRALLPVEHQPKTEEPLGEALERLRHTVREQHAVVERRRRLRLRKRQIERDLRRTGEQDQLWRSRRMRLLRRAKARDEQELRARLERLAERQRLLAQRDERQHELELALERLGEGELIRELLASTSAVGLEQEWTDAQTRQQQAEHELKRLYERRGELVGRWKALAEDPTVPAQQLELALVEARLSEAVEEWQVLAVASHTLDQVRRRFERDRQPEALRLASRYLERLTLGRYLRIWTPLDEATLLVEEHTGQVRRVEDLSRGTREQLYISLRLALVEAYERRGVNLPVVLDDLLVNFDNERARAAVEVLRDFAGQGHQVLLFTCHEHLARLFRATGVRVTDLHGQVLDWSPERPAPAPVLAPEPALPVEPVIATEPAPRPLKLKRRRRPRPVEPEPIEPAPASFAGYRAELGEDFVIDDEPRPVFAEPRPDPFLELWYDYQPDPMWLEPAPPPQPRPAPLPALPRQRDHWRWVLRSPSDADAQDFAGEFSERRVIYDRGERRTR